MTAHKVLKFCMGHQHNLSISKVSNFKFSFQVSSINRVLRNLASSKEQSAHHLSAATADSVYDKLRMFNGQAAAAAGWAWYGAAAGGPTSHLGLGGHNHATSHPALTSHQFSGSVGSNGGSSGDRESADEKKHHLSGKTSTKFIAYY